MAELPKLMLKPLRSGYAFTLGTQTVTTETVSGQPRQRRDSIGTVHRVSPTYKCTRAAYQYLMSFLRVYESLPFLAYLLLDDIDHHWYECRMVGNGTAVSTLGDQIFTVQLSLVVTPIYYNVDVDLDLMRLYLFTDGKADQFYNMLRKLVNERLPDEIDALTNEYLDEMLSLAAELPEALGL